MTDRTEAVQNNQEDRSVSPAGRQLVGFLWRGALALILFLTFVPLIFMLLTSLKDTHQFYHTFWTPAFPIHWENYAYAFDELKGYLINSLIVTIASVVFIVVCSCLAGFMFARYDFPGRELIYYGIIAMMMVPGVLMLIPSFMWAQQIDKYLGGLGSLNIGSIEFSLKFLDSYAVMILPYVASGQILGIYLLRSFFSEIDKSLFEAAEVDGAGWWGQLWHVGLPLARPVVGVVMIVSALAVWNNFLWPLVTTSSEDVMVITVGMLRYNTRAGGRYGEMFAGYAMSAVPLGLLFLVATRQFMRGITSGAIKA